MIITMSMTKICAIFANGNYSFTKTFLACVTQSFACVPLLCFDYRRVCVLILYEYVCVSEPTKSFWLPRLYQLVWNLILLLALLVYIEYLSIKIIILLLLSLSHVHERASFFNKIQNRCKIATLWPHICLCPIEYITAENGRNHFWN